MIAKGNLHGQGQKLAAYLTTGKKGERAELVELRGFASDDIRTAFLDVEIQAYGTRSTKPFFHAYTRLAAGEELTREQWMQVADREEKRLGFAGQPRAVAFHHQPDGATHMHIAWSRIDTERGRAIDPGLYKNKLKELCRTLENQLGLTRVRNERAPEDTTRSAGRNEFEQARRLNTDLKAIRATIRDCWDRSDNGKSFAAALEAEGLTLARGDRRDFVVIDRAGGDHALSKRITGATAAETRGRLGDIDRAQLPSVADAKTRQAGRENLPAPDLAAERAMSEAHQAAKGRVDDTRAEFPAAAARATEPHAPNFDRDAADAAWAEKVADAGIAKNQAGRGVPGAEGRETRAGAAGPSGAPEKQPDDMRPLGKAAGDIRMAWSLTRNGGDLAEALAARGLSLAEVSAVEARQSERSAAFAKEVGNFARQLREGEIVAVNEHGDVHRLTERTTGDTRPDIESRLAGIDRAGLLNVTDTAAVMRDASRAAWADAHHMAREQARPASGIETEVAAALKATMTGHDFAAAIDKAGLIIARVTEADVLALAALREQEGFDRVSGLAHKPRHFAGLEAGDFAAVTRAGDVFRLSPYKLDCVEIEQRLADVERRLPSVTEARALNEIDREKVAELWAGRRADNAAARRAWSDARDADREIRGAARTAEQGVRDTAAATDGAVDRGARTAGGLFDGAAALIERFFAWLVPPPKLTPEQAERAARTAEEDAATREQAAEAQAKDEALEQIFEDARRQKDELHNRFPGLTRDPDEHERDYDRGRERERDRG